MATNDLLDEVPVADSHEVDGFGHFSRREFLKFCAGIAATLGLPTAMSLKIAEAATSPKRPPVIWISAQECTGCTESLLRANHPTLEQLILDTISLDYHETLCAGAGHQAEGGKSQGGKNNGIRVVYTIAEKNGQPDKYVFHVLMRPAELNIGFCFFHYCISIFYEKSYIIK